MVGLREYAASIHAAAVNDIVFFIIGAAFLGIAAGLIAVAMMISDRKRYDARTKREPWLYPPAPAEIIQLKDRRAAIIKAHGPVAEFDKRFRAKRNQLLQQYVQQREEA